MIWENIILAVSSLKSNKMRTLLTMLGIIIGIASVISIMTIGDTMESSVSSSLSSLGTTNIMVNVRERGDENPMFMFGEHTNSLSDKTPNSSDLLTEIIINDFKSTYFDVIQGISLSYPSDSATARDKELYANISITGINDDYTKANSITLIAGREISKQDIDDFANVAVVSDKLADNMFANQENIIGKTIKVYKAETIEIYTIIGVYEYVSSGFEMSTASEKDIQTSMYIPLSTAKKDVIEKNYNSFTIVANVDEDVNLLTDRFQGYFDGIYSQNEDWKVTVTNMASMLDALSDMLSTITYAIAFIAAISLLVGGIGVMNIMLVSVTERTREIGTRKALGAKTFHIQMQFLIEAIIVTLIGGTIGIILGIAIGAFASSLLGVTATVSVFMVFLSFIFSMVIGVSFGLYPASKAAKLDPIEALRYE